jgi:hypothetical protein
MKALNDAIGLFETQQYEEAYSIFLPLANNGNPTAEYFIGLYFRKGIFVKENQKEAFKWFLSSAEHGFLESQFIVASSYLEYPGMAGTPLSEVERNRFEAIMNDNPHYIPFFLCEGVGVKPDIDKSFEWMLKAASQGHDNAINQLPSYIIFHETSRENRVILSKWVDEEIEKNNPAVLYIEGIIQQEHPYKLEEALDLFKNAYEFGYMKAIDRIGELYENKDGKTHNNSEAFKWYTLGAEKHHFAFSAYRLGHLYRNGYGVKKDIDKAIEWFKVAVSNSYYDSWVYACIGKLYQVKGNDIEAIKWFLKGADYFDNDSEMRLKKYYNNGFDVGEKYSAKFLLFEEAKSGDETAQLKYAKRYAKFDDYSGFYNWVKYDSIRDYPYLQEKYIDNFISTINLDDDLKCWEFLADLGNSYAQYIMANRLNNKFTIDYNSRKALYWYKLASTHNIDAQIDMGYFYAHGILVDIDYAESYARYQDVASKVMESNDKLFIRKYSYRMIKYNTGNDKAEEKALCKDVSAMLYMGCLYQHGFEIQQDQEKAIYWYEMASSQGSDEAVIQLHIIKNEMSNL